MDITIVDTQFQEMETYTEGNFSLSFILGRNIPRCAVIFHKDNYHKSYDLNTEFCGTGCEIGKFERWFEQRLLINKNIGEHYEEV